jgi:hypothetical protein
MPRVGFELTVPTFERAKTVHALDRATTVIGDGLLTEFSLSLNVLIGKPDGRVSLGRPRIFGRLILKMELMKIFIIYFWFI